MNRILSILISLVFVIALAGFAFFFTPNTPEPKAVEAIQSKTYENSVHGYALAYPADLDALPYTDDIVAIGHLIDGGIEAIAEVRAIDVEGRAGESLTDAVARSLESLCAADGPGASFSCSGTERREPITTEGGMQGTLLYLQGELREIPSDKVTAILKGPYYVFPLRSSATGSRVLVVHAPLAVSAQEADAGRIETIARSVTFKAATGE